MAALILFAARHQLAVDLAALVLSCAVGVLVGAGWRSRREYEAGWKSGYQTRLEMDQRERAVAVAAHRSKAAERASAAATQLLPQVPTAHTAVLPALRRHP